jgi:hypothetical protein
MRKLEGWSPLKWGRMKNLDGMKNTYKEETINKERKCLWNKLK